MSEPTTWQKLVSRGLEKYKGAKNVFGKALAFAKSHYNKSTGKVRKVAVEPKLRSHAKKGKYTEPKKSPSKRTTNGKKGGSHRMKFGMPSIVGIALVLFALVKFGILDALSQLKAGNWNTAAATIVSRFNLANVFAVGLPAVAVTVARGVTGPVNIMRAGKYQVRLY